MFFGRGLWDTATDGSSIGETRRGCEGENGDVAFGFKAVCVRDRDFGTVFVGFPEPSLGRGGPSDNRASAATHESRSQSVVTFGSRSDLLLNRGICVTKEICPGRTGGGYERGNACGGLLVLNEIGI